MNFRFIPFIALTLFSTNIFSQALDEEIGFIYVKAEYLFETGRFEEAITQYNQVIAKNPTYKAALINRGKSKYQLAVYRGAKIDAIQFMELKGITAESAALLGRAFSSLSDVNAAINSLSAAIAIDNQNPSYYEWRAAVYETDDKILKACQDYEAAMNLGSQTAELKSRSLCGVSKTRPVAQNRIQNSLPPDSQLPEEISNNSQTNTSTSTIPENRPTEVTNNPSVVIDNGQNRSDTPTFTDTSHIMDNNDPIIEDNLPKEDDFANSFVIDEDLTIEISGQELGRRKIKETPSILILADESGRVTVNICVNKAGVVTKAEFNASLSTIAKKSLVSLALRKAKEFEFMPGQYDLQCGFMVFKVKGS